MVRLGVVSRAVVCGDVMFGAVLRGAVVTPPPPASMQPPHGPKAHPPPEVSRPPGCLKW